MTKYIFLFFNSITFLNVQSYRRRNLLPMQWKVKSQKDQYIFWLGPKLISYNFFIGNILFLCNCSNFILHFCSPDNLLSNCCFDWFKTWKFEYFKRKLINKKMKIKKKGNERLSKKVSKVVLMQNFHFWNENPKYLKNNNKYVPFFL